MAGCLFAALALVLLGVSAWAPADEAPSGTLPAGLQEPGIPPRSLAGRPAQRQAAPAEIPDIYGPGAVLTAGNVYMKITNFGVVGNPYPNLSSDPSGQWPGSSGVEYLNAMVLAVGAVNRLGIDGTQFGRVSSGNEWRPATMDAQDRIYRSHEGAVNGAYLFNDDRDVNVFNGEQRFDEDDLDGRDNDGDGRIDEDFAAFGTQMLSLTMRDDSPAALVTVDNETHQPLGLECRLKAWAYSEPGFADFSVVEFSIYNRSGHELDSVFVGLPTDLDAGSVGESAGYFMDDKDVPFFPSGVFRLALLDSSVRRRNGCFNQTVRINGFSVTDGDGDQGRTPGVASVLLLGHTLDPLGVKAPRRTGFRAFRSYVSGTPYASNGAPTIDQQRYEFLSGRQNIDPETGLIASASIGHQGDWAAWNSVGPFRNVPDGGSFTVTIALAVERGGYQDLLEYPTDYLLYRAGEIGLDEILDKYPALENAFTVQLAYEGIYEQPRVGNLIPVPNCAGCESGVKLPSGTPPILIVEFCEGREENPFKIVTDVTYTWFNWDCDICTGIRGHYLRRWVIASPPISPNTNVAAEYNYSDNPGRVAASGDHRMVVAWDNLSENRPDPRSGWFDLRSYRIWKAAEWTRPQGSGGPGEDDWALLSELRYFDYVDSNFRHDPVTDTLVCPKVQVPNYEFPPGHERCAPENESRYPLRRIRGDGGCLDSATVSFCLRRGDLWDRQSGRIVRPDTTVDCVRDPRGDCVRDTGRVQGTTRVAIRVRYPVGRYRYVDRDVKNGFPYFYSITAGDSTDEGELHGRRSAVESEMVTPQAVPRTGRRAWVVPNPYRGYNSIGERPSSWDLTPNATDPTGTHIDFMGLPPGRWSIRIYTVAGDLVAELRSEDAVNAAVRDRVVGEDGVSRPGYNRQQDHAGDGQAQWNLISRNGQDVASGVYMFVVDSAEGQQRGKFVIIR